jgi:glycosyltransferase involved in cell wall biosynthesis
LTDEDLVNIIWLSSEELPTEITDFRNEEGNPGFISYKWVRMLAASLPNRKTIMESFFGGVEKVIVPSNIILKGFSENGVEPEKMRMLPFGLDPSQLERSTLKGQDKTLRFVFIGQIAEHKGVLVLVEAFASLDRELPVSLAIYGDMSLDKNYSDLLLSAASDDARIKFEGHFPPERLGQVIAAHDIVVIPSLWSENTPLVLLASQACGTPAVVSEQEGLCEVVKDGINGLTFKSGSVNDLALCISILLHDRPLVAKLASGTAPGFTIEDNVARLQIIYDQVMH